MPHPEEQKHKSKSLSKKSAITAVSEPSLTKEARRSKPYWVGVGRRKEASAVVRLYEGKGGFGINGRAIADYFPVRELHDIVLAPLKKLGLERNYDVDARVRGGGIRGQAEAVRLGLARRSLGYLTRDSRVKERRKYGLKKARRAPQWAKR